MNKTTTAYYPQSEGITCSKPNTCYCGHGDFKILSDKGRNHTRYLCKGCKKSYIVKDSDAVRRRLSKIGNVLDNVILGMSSRQTCLKMFIDRGLIIKHTTILKWSGESVQYVKMFTDDILCCLEYGSAWGIDETVIGIRGKWHGADAKLLSEMQTMEQKRGDGGFLNYSEFNKEWERLRAKAERSKRSSRTKWLTAVIDLKTRMIIHYVITDRRPNSKEIYRLIRMAIVVAGMPTDIITDCYAAYKPALAKLQKNMKDQNGQQLNHITIRSNDYSTLHLPPKKPENGISRHNNNIESAWTKIKRNMDIMSGYGEYNSDSIIHYNIIHYNFIRPHSSLPKFMATRHDQDSKVNMTPVMAGGYPKWFATFSEVLAESWGYDKSFVFKPGPERMKYLRVGIRDKKVVVASAKEKTSQSKILELDRVLQVECGFTNTPNSNEWKRQMPSILNMNRRRQENMGAVMPEQTFEVCNLCGAAAITTQAVADLMGYRKSGGKIITQPNCHKCRARLSKSPKKRTGANRKRMAKKSILMGTIQERSN